MEGFPPQQGLHPGHQDGLIHRLGEVVVGAGLEPGEDVRRGGLGRDHQDRQARQGRLRFELATDRQAIDGRQQDIEQQEVRLPAGGEGQGLVPRARRQDLVAVHGQAAAEDIDVHRLIIHDQETGWGVHRRPPAPATGGAYAR